MKELERVGLIELTRNGQQFSCTINQELLQPLRDFIPSLEEEV